MKSKIIYIPMFNHTVQVIFGTRKETHDVLIKEYNIPEEDAKVYAQRLCAKGVKG